MIPLPWPSSDFPSHRLLAVGLRCSQQPGRRKSTAHRTAKRRCSEKPRRRLQSRFKHNIDMSPAECECRECQQGARLAAALQSRKLRRSRYRPDRGVGGLRPSTSTAYKAPGHGIEALRSNTGAFTTRRTPPLSLHQDEPKVSPLPPRSQSCSKEPRVSSPSCGTGSPFHRALRWRHEACRWQEEGGWHRMQRRSSRPGAVRSLSFHHRKTCNYIELSQIK